MDDETPPVVVAAEPAADTVPEIETIPNDPEDNEALAARFGENWREVLGMVEPEAEVPVVEPAAAEPPPVEAPPAVEPPAAEPTAVDDETRQLAEVGRQWKQAFSTDPKGALAQLLNSPAFTDADKAELFATVTAKQAAAQVQLDPAKYEPASEFERALMPQLDWMRGGEARVAEALQVRDRDIQHTFVEARALGSKLDAICEFLGLELPTHDMAAIFKHYDSSSEGTLQDAVTKVYRDTAIKAAQAAKQARAPRPETIRNQAPSPGANRQPKTMLDAWQLAGELMDQDA